MDKQTNKTNLKVLAALGLMMTTQVSAVAISTTETALTEHRHKSHHHHRHHQERPDESDNLIIGKTSASPEQQAERRTLDVVREELQAELHNSDDEQEHQQTQSEYSKPEKEQDEIKPQEMAQYKEQIEEYKPEPIKMRKPAQTSKTADLIAQAIIHQNQKAQGMTDDQIYGGASAPANDEAEFEFGTQAQEPKPIAEKIQQIEQKPSKPKFQMAELSEPIQDAQENAVQKTLKLIKQRQENSSSSFIQKPKKLFPIFDKPTLAEREPEMIAASKKVIHKKQPMKKAIHVMSEEENAQAEVEAMLDVEKRQENLRSKQIGGSTKSLVQDSKPAAFGDHLDMHIDSSIIDKVRKDTDKEMTDIESETQRESAAQSKAEESSSEEDQEMTEQEKLYGRQERPEKRSKKIQRPQPVEAKVEEPEQVQEEVKPKYNLSQQQSFSSSTSAEDAKQMAVQKTLQLINKFKKNENLEQSSISPIMSIPEPVTQAPIVHKTTHAYDKDTAIQNILKTIRAKHNLPAAVSKHTLAPIVITPKIPVAPKKAVVRSEVQEIQDKIDQTKLEMKKLPNTSEYGIETSKLDIDESEFVTKIKPAEAQAISDVTHSPKVEMKRASANHSEPNTFQIETTKMDVEIEAPKQETPLRNVSLNKKSVKIGGKPQILQQKKTAEGNEYKIETTSVDMDSLKSIVGDTSDLDLEKMQAQELSKIEYERKRQEKLRKDAEEARLEQERIEKERLAAEKKAAEEEEERQRQEIVQAQIQKMKKLELEENELKEKEMKIKREAQEQAKALKSLPLTVPVVNNKDPKVSQSLSEKPKSMKGEINQMNMNMRGMLKEIVETIQPALEESVGPTNDAKVKVVVTPKGSNLSQGDMSRKSQEFTFDDTRSLNAQSTVAAPVAALEADLKKIDDVSKTEEKKPEIQIKKPEAYPATPVRAEELKPVSVQTPPKPMSPPAPAAEQEQKVEAPAKTEEKPAGPSQSQIQSAIQATLSKIKADKSIEEKTVQDFKLATQKVEQERKETEAKNEALEKIQKEKEETQEKSRLVNLKDSVVANAIKAGKAKKAEKEQATKKLQEALKKKQDQVKALAKQETENMDDLIKVGEATHKNPAISNVVANTIALMKKQKTSLNSGKFSHLFSTLHGEALMQQSESAKVNLPGDQKTAVKSQDKLSNIKNAVKASVVPSKKSLIQLNEDPVDVKVKVDIEDDKDKGAESKEEIKRREEERAETEKNSKAEEEKCAKERGLKDAQEQIESAKKAAKSADKKRNQEIAAHDRQQARDEQKEKEYQATGKRVDKEYKDGQKIVGITMDAATKAQENSQDAVNAAGSAQIIDNRKPDDTEDKKEQAAKDAAQAKESEKDQNQTSGELQSAKSEAKDIQSAIDKVTYQEEKESFLKEQEDKKVKEAQERREKLLQEQKHKEEEARKEDEMRDKITKETNDEIKARQARQAKVEQDREEAKALKDLTIFKNAQEKLNKERKQREAESKAKAEADRKAEFEQKEKELETNQRKVDLEKKKLEDKMKTEKEMAERAAREAAVKAKYDGAFRDGEVHKQQEYAAKVKADAERKRKDEENIRKWEQKQADEDRARDKVEAEKKQQALEKKYQMEKQAEAEASKKEAQEREKRQLREYKEQVAADKAKEEAQRKAEKDKEDKQRQEEKVALEKQRAREDTERNRQYERQNDYRREQEKNSQQQWQERNTYQQQQERQNQERNSYGRQNDREDRDQRGGSRDREERGGNNREERGGNQNRGGSQDRGYGGGGQQSNNYNPQPQQNSGYNGGNRGYNNNNNGYNNGNNNYNEQDNYNNLVQKTKSEQERKSVSVIAAKPVEVKKTEDRKSISTAQVVAQAPKATEVVAKAPAVAKAAEKPVAQVAATPAPVVVTPVVAAKAPVATPAPVVAAKAPVSVATVTPPKDKSQDKGTILIQAEDKPSMIVLDQKDEKDTELFNKADVQDENWLQLTFHKIGMNVKSVFNKLFLPQLQSSNLSHQEKIELMMLWEEHHDQDDK